MKALSCVILLVASHSFLFGSSEKIHLSIPAASVAPVIDGVLNDAAWEGTRVQTGDWLTYNPVRGDRLDQRTEVFLTYDKKHLYFAFRCIDPEPSKIKSSISRRDQLFRDDWVGFSLDSMNNGQLSYDMFVNPNGVQADILTSSSSGEDVSPDWVWDSAGQLTEYGYNVEVRLPLQSIRFSSGSAVQMGMLFWRRVSRLGSSASWPALPAGKSVFECHAAMQFEELQRPRTLEVIPSFTYAFNQDLTSPGGWETDNSKPDAGVSIKYGLTSSIVADLTVNPDFSQVESDAFQVTVNQRYPNFFSEKRPFFMEGMNIFTMAGATGDSNMLSTVHTRRIVDPLWGLKMTGTTGKLTFGTLTASDEAPGRELDDGEINPFLGERQLFNVGRAMYSLGKGRYLGGIVADTELGGEYNRVIGSDFSYRFAEHQEITTTVLRSSSLREGMDGPEQGVAAQATYGYTTDRINIFTQAEHFDPGFAMDTAFYNRTGFTNGWIFGEYAFYPDKKKHSWLRRIAPMIWSVQGRDREQRGNERFTLTGLNFRFTRQGFLRVDYSDGREPWVGKVFKTGGIGGHGQVQLFRWLNAGGFMRFGDGVYYDAVNPFQGKKKQVNVNFTVQPTTRMTQELGVNYVGFRRSSTGEGIYSVKLINTKSIYQFDRRFNVRAIVQYDSSQHRLLSDFLGAYELRPGTVAYLGYGSLYHKQSWRNDRWYQGEGEYLTTRRGFFFKVSYLHRF